MATMIIMPKQGQSVESCILTELKKKKGDTVSEGDILFGYETDKASFEEESKVGGKVLAVFYDEGDEIPVLSGVMVIGEPGENIDGFLAGGGVRAVPGESAYCPDPADKPLRDMGVPGPSESRTVIMVSEHTPDAGGGSCSVTHISRRARALADKYSVDASKTVGSGPGGRVMEKDVMAVVKGMPRVSALASKAVRGGGLAIPDRGGSGLAGMVRYADLENAAVIPGRGSVQGEDSYVEPLSNIRKLIAKSMHDSLLNSAQLTHHLGADARRLLEMRTKAKMSTSSAGITINDMVCMAVVKALREYPQVNAHFLGDPMSVRYFNKVHLALAVDTDRGLMVPVVRDAGSLSIHGLSEHMRELADACKRGSVNPDLLSPEAASFTVSNLGNYGVEMFTPVINLPQVAILGVNAIIPRPKDIGGGVYAFVPHIGLSLTYDHRALDGGLATRFLKRIAIEIESINFEV